MSKTNYDNARKRFEKTLPGENNLMKRRAFCMYWRGFIFALSEQRLISANEFASLKIQINNYSGVDEEEEIVWWKNL